MKKSVISAPRKRSMGDISAPMLQTPTKPVFEIQTTLLDTYNDENNDSDEEDCVQDLNSSNETKSKRFRWTHDMEVNMIELYKSYQAKMGIRKGCLESSND